VKVKIEGLKEFNRTLRKVNSDLPKITTRAHREFATEVRDAARSNARALPGKTKFAGLIRHSAGQNFGAVKLKASHPAAAGWVFGSLRFRRFRRWVGLQSAVDGYGDFGPAAYAVGPAITREAPRVLDQYHRRVQQAFRQAFPGGS